MQIEYAKMLKWFYYNHPNKIDRFVESVSENQQKSKEQLFFGLKEKNIVIPKDENGEITVEIVGGWFGWPLIGMLCNLMSIWNVSIKKINFYELDPFCCTVLRKYIEIFKPYVKINIFNKDWFSETKTRRAHIIINTSCEHMNDFPHMKKYFITPERTLLMLTSNDKVNEPDHINCKKSAIQLAEDNDIHMLHGDWCRFNIGTFEKYIRFIAIGKWN